MLIQILTIFIRGPKMLIYEHIFQTQFIFAMFGLLVCGNL